MEVLRAIKKYGEPSDLFLHVGFRKWEEPGLASTRHKALGHKSSGLKGRDPGLTGSPGPQGVAVSLRQGGAGDLSRVTWVGRQKQW